MGKFSQKIELIANIFIIVVAIVFGVVLIQNYFFVKTTTNQTARIQPTVGAKVKMFDEDWSKYPKTVILGLQTTCHFCNESVPFYKRLVQMAQDKNVKIVAVFPQKIEEATAHLSQLGVTGIEVKQAPISILETSGTPTLILTDNKGEVKNYWVGKLPPEKEMEVIDKLNS